MKHARATIVAGALCACAACASIRGAQHDAIDDSSGAHATEADAGLASDASAPWRRPQHDAGESWDDPAEDDVPPRGGLEDGGTPAGDGPDDAGGMAPGSKDAGSTPPTRACDGGAPRPTAEDAGLRVQYRAADTDPANKDARPHLLLTNQSGQDVPLSELVVRYWLTCDDAASGLEVHCDYAQIGCGSIQTKVVEACGTLADHAIELSFTGGMLPAHGTTGELQLRFNASDWTNLDESDDYSYAPSQTSFADSTRVTLYRDGVLVWGEEPR